MSQQQPGNSGSTAGGGGNPLGGVDVPYAGALLRVGAMAALHPVDYAKTLIQIGHEPLAPAQTKTLLTQRPALALPSVFRYCNVLLFSGGKNSNFVLFKECGSLEVYINISCST